MINNLIQFSNEKFYSFLILFFTYFHLYTLYSLLQKKNNKTNVLRKPRYTEICLLYSHNIISYQYLYESGL